MATLIYKNFASAQTTAVVNSGDTTIIVDDGSVFPIPTGDEYFVLVLEDVEANKEITHCTNVAGNSLTLVRAQEGTIAQNFSAGSRAEERITAGWFDAIGDQVAAGAYVPITGNANNPMTGSLEFSPSLGPVWKTPGDNGVYFAAVNDLGGTSTILGFGSFNTPSSNISFTTQNSSGETYAFSMTQEGDLVFPSTSSLSNYQYQVGSHLFLTEPNALVFRPVDPLGNDAFGAMVFITDPTTSFVMTRGGALYLPRMIEDNDDPLIAATKEYVDRAGGLGDAVADGNTYGRKDNEWSPISVASGDYLPRDGSLWMEDSLKFKRDNGYSAYIGLASLGGSDNSMLIGSLYEAFGVTIQTKDSTTGKLSEFSFKANGQLQLPEEPTADTSAVTKKYVDDNAQGVEEAPSDGQEYVRKDASWALVSTPTGDYLPRDGSLPVTVAVNFLNPMLADNTASAGLISQGPNDNTFVFASDVSNFALAIEAKQSGAVNRYVFNKSGHLELPQEPLNSNHAATKAYVDGKLPDGGGEDNTTSNLGGGAHIAAAKTGVDLPMRSLVGLNGIVVTERTDDITIEPGAALDADYLRVDGGNPMTGPLNLTNVDNPARGWELLCNGILGGAGNGLGVSPTGSPGNGFFVVKTRTDDDQSFTFSSDNWLLLPSVTYSAMPPNAAATKQYVDDLLTDNNITTSNVGAGTGLALARNDDDLPFRSLIAGDNVEITSDATSVTITATTSGPSGDYVERSGDTMSGELIVGANMKVGLGYSYLLEYASGQYGQVISISGVDAKFTAPPTGAAILIGGASVSEAAALRAGDTGPNTVAVYTGGAQNAAILRYGTDTKLTTQASGVDVTGNVDVTGQFLINGVPIDVTGNIDSVEADTGINITNGDGPVVTVGLNTSYTDGRYLRLSGGTVSGPVTMTGGSLVLQNGNGVSLGDGSSAGLVAQDGGTTRLDSTIGGSVVIKGSVASGTSIDLQGGSSVSTLSIAGGSTSKRVDLKYNGATKLATSSAGVSITGNATISGTPSAGSHLIDRDYADGRYSQTSHTHSYLPLSGGTLTGDLSIGSLMSFDESTGNATLGGVTVGGVGGAIKPNANNAVNNGTSSLQWAQVRGVTLYENNTSLASKYAALSHTHNYGPVYSGGNGISVSGSTITALLGWGMQFSGGYIEPKVTTGLYLDSGTQSIAVNFFEVASTGTTQTISGYKTFSSGLTSSGVLQMGGNSINNLATNTGSAQAVNNSRMTSYVGLVKAEIQDEVNDLKAQVNSLLATVQALGGTV